MPQLDGIRAVAAAMVVVYHFYPSVSEPAHLGSIGVRVFFVLSGFLITGILLRTRVDAGDERGSRGRSLRRFYIRRVLRIFPLYYFALAIAWKCRLAGVRPAIGWHLAYLSNVRFFLENAATPGRWGGPIAHFWSLAVEEQFYLFWPWVIFFAPRRWLPGITLGLVALGPAFRYIVARATGNDIPSALLPGSIDALALGAYLAMAALPELRSHPWVRPVGRTVLGSGLVLLAACFAAEHWNIWWDFRMASFDLAAALLGMWLVARAAHGMEGPVGDALAWTPVRYLGTISYGIYVYHLMLPDVFAKVLQRIGHPDLLASLGFHTLPYLAFYGAATVAVAALSWHCLEAPINRLKDRFEYR